MLYVDFHKATLQHGDCLPLMAKMPSGSVDLVLADLPYGTTQCRWDSPLPLEQLWAEYERLCRGTIVLFAQTPFDKVLGASNIKKLRYEWIWEKGNASGHLNANRAPMKCHENILVFSNKAPTYNPIKTSGHVRKAAVKRRGDTTPVYGKQDFDELSYDSTDRYPRDVIRFASEKQRGSVHPTQKPVALCEYLIRTHSNEGEIVLDNCMGSGTTGVAAVTAGRRFIGMELEREWFDVAKARLGSILC
jgi:site-specific DNA-methyltransferase (adenine-specific)